ncbi:glycosyltransferase [Lachnospiraceae bacterium MD335]|nr:glycosyltransferase [Lachnospiraceae bacterium MD335]
MYNKDHTFAICAYEVNPYLEECLLSVLNQKMKTNVIITTSTPNDYIKEIAAKYNVPLIINSKYKAGVTEDYNFAYHSAPTQYVTICHQDDIYLQDYSHSFYEASQKASNMLIFFSNYCEVRDGKKVSKSKVLNIKRFMLLPLKLKCLWKSKFVRRCILAFGSAICCPSVNYNKSNLQEPIFTYEFHALSDWCAWEAISRKKGEFVYCSKMLMGHRIHNESWTSQAIRDNVRESEEIRMFQKFWPKPIANLIEVFYRQAEKSNEM